METINKKILEFISKNQVATICFTNSSNKPYCINCFYHFDDRLAILIVKSSYGTSHDAYVKSNKPTSGTIIADQIELSKLKGIQFTGSILDQQQINELKLNVSYVKKFPLSVAMPGYVWGIQLEYLKFTDNSFGFGNKIVWKLINEQ